MSVCSDTYSDGAWDLGLGTVDLAPCVCFVVLCSFCSEQNENDLSVAVFASVG